MMSSFSRTTLNANLFVIEHAREGIVLPFHIQSSDSQFHINDRVGIVKNVFSISVALILNGPSH